MNRRITRVLLPAIAVFAWCTTGALAQHDKNHDHDHKNHDHAHGDHDHAGQMSPEDIKAMQAWMQHSTPGEHHEHIKFFAGNWKYSGEFYMAPGAPPMKSSGTVEAKLQMGGRFLVTHWKGPAMFGPTEFRGMEVLGYDNTKKQYHSTWIDNMTTSTATSIGTCDESGKVFTHKGAMFDPNEGVEVPSRTVLTIINDDKYVLKMYENKTGQPERLTMEFTVTRVTGG